MDLQKLHYALSFASEMDADAKTREGLDLRLLHPNHVAVARALLARKAEKDKVDNQLHKADIKIAKLTVEVRELRAAKEKLEAPRFSPG